MRNFTLLQTPPGVLEFFPADLYILPHADSNKLTLITCSPLESYEISPVSFFDGQPDGIRLIARIGRTLQDTESWKAKLSTFQHSPISRFVRTAEGKCVGVLREEEIELQLVSERGTQLVWKQRSPAADHLVVLDKGTKISEQTYLVDPSMLIGRSFATYDRASNLLTLQTVTPSTLKIPTVQSLFTTVINEQPSILGITPDYLIVRILANLPDTASTSLPFSTAVSPSSPIALPTLELISITKLPLDDQEYSNLKFIIPVDPMGWTDLYNPGTRTSNPAQLDALLSVSEDGELVFWAAEDHLSHSSFTSEASTKAKEIDPVPKLNQSCWKCTGIVRTGRKGIRIAACSSTKKSVLGIYRCRLFNLKRLTRMTSGAF